MNLQEQGELITAAQRGDKRAFDQLYTAFVEKVYQYLYYRVHNEDIAYELTSEVFLRAIEGLPNYSFQGTSFLAWLYSIAHARLIDFYRQSKRSVNNVSLDSGTVHIHSSDEDLESAVLSTLENREVYEAISHLTTEQQQVIYLRFIDGNSLQEVAEVMGKSVGAIKLLQFRAIQSLANILNGGKKANNRPNGI